ncbi:hypothetical protein BQ8482_120088 [Mesorhizobium delmotii]|uniref:Uncharacterized protein n=1 Tax=Mesorhizobium delmotii TaxID=1631247 RepID=A0A2P9AFX8_9HYPH|nr:hypothetical protein BQ8482_120088 [Mesorhizobium delmotii]
MLAILHRARHAGGLPMSGYFGTEVQQRLQAQAEASFDFINATPGACQTGRTMGVRRSRPVRVGNDRQDTQSRRHLRLSYDTCKQGG